MEHAGAEAYDRDRKKNIRVKKKILAEVKRGETMKRYETPFTIYFYPYTDTVTAIEVYKPSKSVIDLRTMNLTRINWGGCGSVTPDEAEAFALTLLEAAKEAKKINENNA